MDLCLRGSQINLIERKKLNKINYYHNFNNSNKNIKFQRPYSALTTFSGSGHHYRHNHHFQHHSHHYHNLSASRSSLSSSSILTIHQKRPMSADNNHEKLFFKKNLRNQYGVRFCERSESEGSEKSLKRNNKFSLKDGSSSNILKILLNEPIKRSWLCDNDDYNELIIENNNNHKNLHNKNNNNHSEKNHKKNFNLKNKNKKNLQIKKNHKNFIVKYNEEEIFHHKLSIEEQKGHNYNSPLNSSSCDNKKSVLRFSSSKSPKNFKNQNYNNCKSSNEFYLNENSERMSYMNNNGNSDKYYSSSSKTKNSQNGGSARTGSGSIGGGSRSGSGSASGSGREINDFWHSKKPDLPGRVSFGKIAVTAAPTTTTTASNISKNFHIDYSDGEIDIDNNQINDNNNFTKTTTTTTKTSTGNDGIGETPSSIVSMSTSKKSVHFGEHTEVVPSASTSSSSATCHQYTSSSCSNENCPCVCMKKTISTTLLNPEKEQNHSSTILEPSTSSLKYFTTDNKCEYDDHDDYCGKGLNYRTFSEFSSSLKNDELKKFSSCKEDTELLEKESKIIENYKNEIDDESKKLQLEIKMAEKNDKNNDNYDGIDSILDTRYRNLLSTTATTTSTTTSTTISSTGNILLSPTGIDNNNHHHLHLHHYHHRPSMSYEGLSKYETELQQQQQQQQQQKQQQQQQQQTDNNPSKIMTGQLKNNLSSSTTKINEISNDKQQNNNNNNNNNKNNHVSTNNNNNTVNLDTNCNNSNKNHIHKSHDNKTSQTSPPSSAVQQQQSPPASSSVVNNSTQTLNPIINNYLKVSTNSITTTTTPKSSATSTTTTTKKLNNSINTKRCRNKQCSATSKSTTSTRSKSVSSVTDSTVQHQQQHQQPQKKNLNQMKNLKKSETFSCLRQDSNLDEFHLDNIDSWMSIQQCNNPDCHDSNCMNKKYQQQQQQQQQQHHHRHHYHHHFSSSPKDSSRNLRSSGDGGVGGGGDGYAKHCHHFLSSSVGKYESHDDTDTPEHFSKTTEESTGSHESSETGTTYDEIISVIKEMEDEKKKDIPRDSSTDLDIKFQNILQSDGSDISTVRKDEEESPDKLKDILSYLEDVENSCERTLLETRRSLPEMSRSSGGAVEFTIEPDIEGTVPKIADLITQPPNALARRIIALTLRSNELTNAIQLSREHLARLRQEKQKSIRIEKQNTLNRLREQKKHYENMLARHQGFIEQLLKDKGSLCDKVTALTRRIESQNQAWEHKLETEIARAKEIALAGEKVRRERWVRENTKKIKDLTVKGVESEIEKMNAAHQKEITELKKSHQQELSNALEDARQKHEQIIKSIREQCAQDREAIIEKERSAIRERFERQLQEEQKSFDEQKSKLLEDFATERERLLRELRQKDEEFEKRRQEFHKEKELAIEQLQSEYNERLEQQEQKYQNKINAMEKQFESDFLIWKREFENACKLREVENENGIRQHYRAERDRQIDAIVSRMDAESQKTQEEFELKLSRLKEKYDSDLREVENVEKSLRDKYNETRNKLAESNAEVQNLQAEIKQLQIELEHSRKMCDEFLTEKESMKENVRNEVQVEIATIKSERDEEIQKIHKRVQQAIEKKDAAMELLQKDNASLRERCMKLEQIIRQQRKDYCIK